jgi:hypothetical protein
MTPTQRRDLTFSVMFIAGFFFSLFGIWQVALTLGVFCVAWALLDVADAVRDGDHVLEGLAATTGQDGPP